MTIGPPWSSFSYINWELSWWDNHLSSDLAGQSNPSYKLRQIRFNIDRVWAVVSLPTKFFVSIKNSAYNARKPSFIKLQFNFFLKWYFITRYSCPLGFLAFFLKRRIAVWWVALFFLNSNKIISTSRNENAFEISNRLIGTVDVGYSIIIILK